MFNLLPPQEEEEGKKLSSLQPLKIGGFLRRRGKTPSLCMLFGKKKEFDYNFSSG